MSLSALPTLSEPLVIGWLYPKLMSTYGDRGNVTCLQRRCEWRGIPVRIQALDRDTDPSQFTQVDLIVGGGAQDRQQEIVMRDLQGAKAAALKGAIEAGVPGVFTCGAPQLLGHYYEPGLGQRIQGLGVLDLVTVHPGPDAPRCIGNLVLEVTAERLARELRLMLGDVPYLIGFENHGGRTKLGSVEPLARVVRGLGNNGEDQTEGAFHCNAIATYSHGPLLPKNPFLADWMIQTAIARRTGESCALNRLDDSLADRARSVMLQRLSVG
ncbi:cobalamin biosynthesis protein CobQ [Limnothrix sp. FACHB-708]|uniref:type 1 glutamine amidotransferase n=1 Tax=unclassified Limnothrix TaxID=2632864 RepID=UPI0016870C95|nr:cobalamin biosynthesis protein CobQ [Limnothrix sp. FACHB-708]MBD2591457.1 cobalamin biosynthesis protein CobQ [Limnothrix sp. FACHB-406]